MFKFILTWMRGSRYDNCYCRASEDQNRDPNSQQIQEQVEFVLKDDAR